MKLSIVEVLKGIKVRILKEFKRPYSKFNISWLEEKKLKHSHPGQKYTHLYKNKYLVEFTDPKAFMYTVRELFIDEIYKFTPDNNSPYIIDCGAYIGTSILFFKDNYPDAKILGFEPDNKNLKLLKKNLSNWTLSDITIENAAIWISNGHVTFASDGNMASKITQGEISESNEHIKSIRLNDLLNKDVDFLKIDIEGAEYEVIKDCAENLSYVKNLFIEYHGNYDEMYKLNEILNILVNNGFKYYIKEAGSTYNQPFFETKNDYNFDIQLNLFAFKRK